MKKMNFCKGLFLSLALGASASIVAQPTASAPTPPIFSPTKVIAIFSDAYTSVPGVNFNPFWGQSTQVKTIQIGTDNVLEYTNLNYQGTEFADQNCASMTHIHIDVWAAAAATIGLSPINHAPAAGEPAEQSFSLVLKANQWNSFDIPLTTFNKMSFTAIWQFKVDLGTGQTIYLDNLYFYNNSTTEDTTPPTAFTAAIGKKSYNSIELLLNATDDSKAVTYDITYNGKTESTGGASGTQRSVIITGLESNTEYSFSVAAKDASGNVAANSPLVVSARTAAAFAAPTTAAPAPTFAASNVISIFSDAYTPVTTFSPGSWGQTTVMTNIKIADNNVMKLENFNYIGLELNNNTPAFNATTFTHLHVDVWTPNAASFQITPIGVGENLYTCTPLTLNTWNSFNIPLTAFPNVQKDKIIQIKMVGTGEQAIVYIDNIYFHNNTGTSVTTGTASMHLYVDGNTLRFSSDVAQVVEIINTTGQTIYRTAAPTTTLNHDLQPGVYIIRTDNVARKVIVR